MRLAFIGLWCASDREGRFKWEPRRLGASILPYDGIDFSRVLDALTTRGFIERHASQGVEFGVIPSFLRHQLINNRESPSSLPVPTEESMVAGLPTREPRVTDACGTREVRAQGEGKEGKEGKGNGKGEEGESSHASGQASRLLLNDWTPDSGHSGICAQRNLSMEMQLERFRSLHGATLDTPDGWSRRFYGWIAQGRPEPIPLPAVATPGASAPPPEWVTAKVDGYRDEIRRLVAEIERLEAKQKTTTLTQQAVDKLSAAKVAVEELRAKIKTLGVQP
jgi:hypothetical protein